MLLLETQTKVLFTRLEISQERIFKNSMTKTLCKNHNSSCSLNCNFHFSHTNLFHKTQVIKTCKYFTELAIENQKRS
jgi:hypothetical protein